MKKLSTILMAAVFMLSAGACFAGTNALQDYQAKRNAAIQKQDAKISIAKETRRSQRKEKLTKLQYKKKQQAQKKHFKKTTAKKRCGKKPERLF